jgi:integrase
MNFIPRKEECFMNKHFTYKSVLATYIKGFIHMKEAAGCNFLRGKWILFEIDRFFQENNVLEPVITRELVQKWRKTRINDSPATIYSKYSIISQLARYMSCQGRECFIPRLPGFCSSKWNFAPYIFTHKQIDRLFCRSNMLRMYDRHMSNTMFSVPAVLRMIYSTGLRVSEALSIKNADIKFDQRHILIRKTQNGCERIVPINDGLCEVLQQYAIYRDKIPVRHVSSPNSFSLSKAMAGTAMRNLSINGSVCFLLNVAYLMSVIIMALVFTTFGTLLPFMPLYRWHIMAWIFTAVFR